jgi:hypothetical protein
MEVSKGTNHDWLMHAIRSDVPLRLVSSPAMPCRNSTNTPQRLEQLLQFLPPSCAPARHHDSWLRSQLLLLDLLHLQPNIWRVSLSSNSFFQTPLTTN